MLKINKAKYYEKKVTHYNHKNIPVLRHKKTL